MSTRSRIALRLDNGFFTSVYCRYDGYDKNNGVGQQLRRYFTEREQVASLIELGDLSYIEKDQPHAYHRDMNRPWRQNQPKTSCSQDALLELASACDAHYVYIFDNSHWCCHRLA